MTYIEKSTNNEYEFIKKDSDGKYLLERELNKIIKNGRIIKEKIYIPEDILNEYYELKE